MRNSTFHFHCNRPAIANGPKRLDRVILERLDDLTVGFGEGQNIKNAVARCDKVTAERAKFAIAEGLMKLTDSSAATLTFVFHVTALHSILLTGFRAASTQWPDTPSASARSLRTLRDRRRAIYGVRKGSVNKLDRNQS
jgi:hypothetical protein